MADAAEDREEAKSHGIDPEAADRFLALQRELREARQREGLKKPVTRPQDLMVRDPETGKRKAFHAVTEEQGLHITFRAMTLGEHQDIPAEAWEKPFGEWPLEVKAKILDRNLVEPDLRGEAGGEVTPEWCERNLAKLDIDDLVYTIVTSSQARLRVPAPAEDDEKKSLSTGADTSPSPTRTGGFTNSDTGLSVPETPTESP